MTDTIVPSLMDIVGETDEDPKTVVAAIELFADAIGSGGGGISDGSVTTSKLADGSVTTSKLDDEAVTAQKIENTFLTVDLPEQIATYVSETGIMNAIYVACDQIAYAIFDSMRRGSPISINLLAAYTPSSSFTYGFLSSVRLCWFDSNTGLLHIGIPYSKISPDNETITFAADSFNSSISGVANDPNESWVVTTL